MVYFSLETANSTGYCRTTTKLGNFKVTFS